MGIRTHADELIASYSTTTPEELHSCGLQLLSKVMHGIDESLAPLKVDAACLCALTGYTSGRPEAGFTFASMAATFAEATGQPELIARAAGAQAIFYSTCDGIGDVRKAVALRQRSADNAEPGVMRAWALANLAAERAALGDARRTIAALREAERQWGRGFGHGLFSTDGFLKGYGSPAAVLGMSGRALALLGHGKSALFELGDALSLNHGDGPRRTAILYVDSVLAHVAADQPEQACSAAQTALDLCQESGYELGVQRIRKMRARFPASWAGLSCMADLDERLRII